MIAEAELFELLTARALRRLAESYAHAVDDVRGDALAELFVPDGVLESPSGIYRGRDAIRRVPDLVRSRYRKTFHAVLNQRINVTAESAEAATYCIARHLCTSENGQAQCYEMTIRYQDRYRCMERQWYFVHRCLIVDWTQMFSVRPSEANRE